MKAPQTFLKVSRLFNLWREHRRLRKEAVAAYDRDVMAGTSAFLADEEYDIAQTDGWKCGWIKAANDERELCGG